MFIKEKASVLSQIQAYSSNKPTLADAKNVFYVIGYFLKMPIILLATWGSVLCYRYSRPSQLKRSFNIFSLAQYSQKYFPQIRPAFINNLLDKGHDDGSYRQEVSPIRLAILNNAVTYTGENGISYKVAFGKKLMMNDTKKLMTIIDSYNEDEGLPILHGRIKINIKKIREIFKYQIIKHGEWKEPNNLSPQLKALYAIFLLFIEGGSDNKERAFEMLDKFSSTYKSTRSLAKNFMFDDSGVDDVISELGTQVAVKKIQEKHTYTITVLMAMYHRATHRKSKLPPSRFLWLKEADRGAWYALHQNLSPGAWSEGAGPRGIFLTEIKLNKMAQYPFTAVSYTHLTLPTTPYV